MITAIVLTKDESESIARCLSSLSWCDQILVVDDHSIDDTVSIAKKLGAKVVVRNLAGNFSAQRNWAHEQVDAGWSFFVDADEEVGADLKKEIIHAISSPKGHDAFSIPRHDILWGKCLKYGDVGNVRFVRLAKAGVGKWHGQVHESWQEFVSVGQLKSSLLHFPHPTISSFLDHINVYSTLKSEELLRSKKRVTIFQVMLAPIWRFFKNFILKLGVLDGTPGCIHAMMMAMYVYLVASKTYLAQRTAHASAD